MESYYKSDNELTLNAYELFNVIENILTEVLTIQEIPFYCIHDSLHMKNVDDCITLLSHLDQLYDGI